MNKNFAELDAEANAKVYYGANNQVALNAGQLPNALGSGFLLRDTGGTPAIAMYVDGSGNPILKVAKTGKDAVLGVGSDLIFNSSQNVYKVVMSGVGKTITPGLITASASTWTSNSSAATINHNLGYVPAALVYLDFSVAGDGTNMISLPWTYIPTTGPNSSQVTILSVYFAIDKTNLTIIVSQTIFGGSSNIGVFPFKYYLLQESAI